jgi:hypothetical protein
MAPDVRTFQALQTSLISPDIDQAYFSRDDESEADQLKQLGGIGNVLTDDDIKTYNSEGFGINFREFEQR